jgi:uncharacterized protein YggT (Ycf19 family)
MFWKRTTTTTTNSPSEQSPAQSHPIAQTVPASVASVAVSPTYQPVATVPVASVAAAPTYTAPVQATVPVPVVSVAPAAQYSRTYVPVAPAPAASEVRHGFRPTRITDLVWLLAAVLESLLGIRVILALVNANPEAGFAQLITKLTAPFLAPFTGLMTNPTTANGAVLEVTTLVAMLVYALVAWGIVRLIWIILERRVAR